MNAPGHDPPRDGEEPRRSVLGGEDGRPPVLVLQEGPSHRTRRRRRIVAVLLVVAALAGAYLGRDALERWTGLELPFVSPGGEPSRTGSSSAAAASGDPASPPDATAGAAGLGEAASPADLLERRLDSLSVVLDRYRERHGDFVQGRLGCQGLTDGFTEVEDRFAAASRAFGRLEADAAGGEPVTAGGLADRYRRLSTTTDSLGRLYVASGCVEEGDEPPE